MPGLALIPSIKCKRSIAVHTYIESINLSFSLSRFSLNVTMRFTGDYDTLTRNPNTFKLKIKESLVFKYGSKIGLLESQIKAVYLSRGSVIITVTVEDGTNWSRNGNVTHLLIQMEQDVRNLQYMSHALTLSLSLEKIMLTFISIIMYVHFI